MAPTTRSVAQTARGFSLVEFMIAITVSLVILAALTSTFVANSRARTELERANQQIENGRYSLSVLSDDLDLAGYLSHLDVDTSTFFTPAAKIRPCAISLQDLHVGLPLHIQGYDNVPDADSNGAADVTAINDDATAATDLDCIPANDVRPNTDILVVRHVSTCIRGAANCPAIAGAPYFQASLCDAEVSNALGWDLPFINARPSFRLDTNIGNLNRTNRNCTGLEQLRRYLVNIYFVANNDRPGDRIPTLKRTQLTGVSGTLGFQTTSLANGIENLQVEYGLDCSDGTGNADCTGDGVPEIRDGSPDISTSNPDRYNRAAPGTPFANCAANANCMQNWMDVTSVKIAVLARNPQPTRNYVDSKIYTLGRQLDGTAQCALDANNDGTCEAFNDSFRRHVYQTSIRIMNPSARREQ